MLVLAPATLSVIGAGRILPRRAGLEDIYDLRPGQLRFPLANADTQPVTLRRERHENHETLSQPGEM